MCVWEIEGQVSMYNQKVQRLKDKSSYYPSVYCEFGNEHDGRVLYGSTLVRTCWQGVWYKVHLVLFTIYNEDLDALRLMRLVTKEAFSIQHLYIPVKGSGDEVDDLQISEKERLIAEMSDL